MKTKHKLLIGLTVLSLCQHAQPGMDYSGFSLAQYSRLRSNFPLFLQMQTMQAT